MRACEARRQQAELTEIDGAPLQLPVALDYERPGHEASEQDHYLRASQVAKNQVTYEIQQSLFLRY